MNADQYGMRRSAVDLLAELNASDESPRIEAKRAREIGKSIMETVLCQWAGAGWWQSNESGSMKPQSAKPDIHPTQPCWIGFARWMRFNAE